MTTKSTKNPFETGSDIFSAKPLFANNPFTNSTSSDEIVEGGEAAFAPVVRGPAVDPSEVEQAGTAAVEVRISWGSNPLHIAHLTPPRSFFVGEEEREGARCDYLLPAEKLGATRAPLTLVRDGRVYVVFPRGSSGTIDLPGRGRVTAAQADAEGLFEACPDLDGARMIALPAAAQARFTIGDFTIDVRSVAAGKRLGRALVAGASLTGMLFVGLSFVAHASLLGGMAMYRPAMDGVDEDTRGERELLMQQTLKTIAEKEKENTPEEVKAPESGEGSQGTGAQAKGPSGVMGSTTSKQTGGRFAIAGRKENTDPHMARQAARDEAARFGMIGLLQTEVGGSANAPVAPWGRDSAEGNDASNALGNMWGASVHDSAGAGGLGLFGVGSGAGGQYEGVGMGKVGTVGHGSGLAGDGQYGSNGSRLGQGDHKVRTPGVRMSTPTVNGRIAPEVIQRIVRQGFGRYKLCYQDGLRRNTELAGRVTVRFVIGRDGAVASVANGGSDLPDNAVVSCVVKAFSGLSFPEPEGGIVTVNYPISFSPGN